MIVKYCDNLNLNIDDCWVLFYFNYIFLFVIFKFKIVLGCLNKMMWYRLMMKLLIFYIYKYVDLKNFVKNNKKMNICYY